MSGATATPFIAAVRARRLSPRGLTLAVLTGQAMASLDASIVNVGAPAIERGLHLSPGALQLAIYAYLLTYASGLIIAARLGSRHGFGAVFSAGLALFTLSSLACGLAADPAMLVAARAVQGIGAALLVAQVLSLLQSALHGERRRRALSLYGMVLAAGVAAGQVLGGVLVTANVLGYGWRPIFLVNVPAGALVLLLAGGRLPGGSRAADGAVSERDRLDMIGALSLVGAMLALLIPLSFGAAAGWPAWCWPSLAAGAGLLVWFAAHERRTARRGLAPLIDVSLLRRASMGLPLAGVFALMGCYGGLLLTAALYMQGVLHETPLHSGLTFAAYPVGFATASLTWDKLPVALHGRVPAAGFALMSASTAALAFAVHGAWPWYATALLVGVGAGHGAGFGGLVRRVTGELGADDAASFSGVLATTNQLSIATGIAAAGTSYAALANVPGTLSKLGVVLVALAAVEALVGAAVGVRLGRFRRSADAVAGVT